MVERRQRECQLMKIKKERNDLEYHYARQYFVCLI